MYFLQPIFTDSLGAKLACLAKIGVGGGTSDILGFNVFLDSLNLQKLGLIVLLVRFYCHHSQIK